MPIWDDLVSEKLSEHTVPRDIRDYDHDTNQEYQDLVPAFLADTENGGMTIVTIFR